MDVSLSLSVSVVSDTLVLGGTDGPVACGKVVELKVAWVGVAVVEAIMVIVGEGQLEGRGVVDCLEKERVGVGDKDSLVAGIDAGLRTVGEGESELAPFPSIAGDGVVTGGMTSIVAGLSEG